MIVWYKQKINHKISNGNFFSFCFFILSCLLLNFVIVFNWVWSAPNQTFPRKANYFLNWNMTESQARELARWDLLILDMEQQVNNRDLLKKIRVWNNDIVILAYITPQEIKKSNPGSYGSMRQKLINSIGESWYLKNSQGQKLSWWPNTYLLNVTNESPVVNGQVFNNYLAHFVAGEILSTGLWDGVFYDNTWDSITWFVGSDIDFNLDGRADLNLDQKWQAGMKNLYNKTRELTNNRYIIVGNGTTRQYLEELNGKMLENFSTGESWSPTMDTYSYNFSGSYINKVNIINSNTNNNGQQIYSDMRFGLASSLLEDGYFSYDYGDINHGQTWWYDEYDVDLGAPLAKSVSKNNYNTYRPDVWKRDFSNGLAVVNSTAQAQKVELGGEYEKIHGGQDPTVNDGSIITETTIDGYDGLVLLKTFASLNDVLFRNGDFVRFFDSAGNRVRNGFFIFEDGYKGGDKIAHIDIDGNGSRDLLVVSGNKIMAWRSDGQVFMKLYPYTVNYKAELKVAIGDLNADGKMEIYVAPEPGYDLPIRIYTRDGIKMRHDWYPFGEGYKGGYSLALGHITGTHRNDLVIAKASDSPAVSIFDYNYKLAYQWLAFDKNSRFGVNVGAGDVDGDKIDEVLVGAGEGGKPIIRIFEKDGVQVGNDIITYTSFNTPGTEVLSADVDFDGKDDVIGMGSGF